MFVSYTMSGPALPQGRLTLHMDAATEVRVQRLFKNRNVELTEAIVDAIALLAIPQEIRDA